MIPQELFEKVRRIEISTSRLVTDVFAGQYHSAFKGQGIEFDEVREYQIGDDVRAIDWNVTARTGRPFIKKYVEERELTVMVLVDVSPSNRFGTVHALKSQMAAEISALIALSAIRNNDKVGLILFSDQIELFIPPRKGRQHVLRIIREVLNFESTGKRTDFISALEYLNRVVTRKSIAFYISDFLFDEQTQLERLRKTISITNKRHDLVVIALQDPAETALSPSAILALQDAENGEVRFVDSLDGAFRKSYEGFNEKRIKQRNQLLRSCGVDCIELITDKSYVDELVKFFKKRKSLK